MASVTFIHPDGKRVELTVKIGESLLEIAQAHGIPIEGACEGSMACGTCHVIVDPAWTAKLAKPSDEEQDMLDLVYGLTRRSRLGCQIRMTPELDGLVVALPA